MKARGAVVYVRVSSAQQVGNFSLDVQDAACRVLCAREGWPVMRVFREEGESAKTADRTRLIELMDYCRQNKARIAAVVVHSISRWSRDTSDHFELTKLLRGWGIALRSATEAIDDTPSGELMEGVHAVLARFDNRQRTDRTVAGMRQALGSGRWTHRAPLGYVNGPRGNRHEPSLLPNPETAEMVRTAFDLYATSDLSEREVQRRLVARGFTMQNGKAISLQTVSKTLRNPAYAGFLRLPSWGVDVRGDWEALVSEETFNRAQVRLAGEGPPIAHVRERDDFPLRSFALCGMCGKPLTASWSRSKSSKLYAYYECRRGHTPVRVPKDDLEGYFLWLLMDLQPSPAYMTLFKAVVSDVWKKRESTARADRARLEEQVRAARVKLDRIADDRADGTMDKDTYMRQHDRLQQNLAVAEVALADAVVDHLDVEGILGFMEAILADVSRMWENALPDQKRRLQRTLFPEGVTYEPGSPGRLRTPVTCLAFNGLATPHEAESAMVALRGFEPRFDG